MDVSNFNINEEILNNSSVDVSDEVKHIIIDKSLGDYFLELVFFVLRCLFVCFIPFFAYYFFVLFTWFKLPVL